MRELLLLACLVLGSCLSQNPPPVIHFQPIADAATINRQSSVYDSKVVAQFSPVLERQRLPASQAVWSRAAGAIDDLGR